MFAIAIFLSIFVLQVYGQSEGQCKEPYVEQRNMADDVRYAAPFYVIALPRNSRTEQMDNICYTYFENKNGGFFHIMSITLKNGSGIYHQFTKADIPDRTGIAQGSGTECVYHDYTLKPICDNSVFILYRCFIRGTCGNIDIGITPDVDVRVTLAATTKISPECRSELESSLRNTSSLAGDNYIILPQKRKPQCITKYNNLTSVGYERALGSIDISDGGDLTNRFGDDLPSNSAEPSPSPAPSQSNWNQNTYQRVPPPSAYNPYGSQVKPQVNNVNTYPQTKGPVNRYGTAGNNGVRPTNPTGTYGTVYPTVRPGQSPAPGWTLNHVQRDPPQWNGQTIQPGADVHYHIWQSAAAASVMKGVAANNPNVYYHIHRWDNPPPGCCKCN